MEESYGITVQSPLRRSMMAQGVSSETAVSREERAGAHPRFYNCPAVAYGYHDSRPYPRLRAGWESRG